MQPTSSHPGPAPDPGLSPLKRAFLALESSQQRVAALERAAKEPIAVIGIGCRVPGADNPDAFWRLMRDGVDAISTVPPDRFDIDALFDPDPETSGRIATRFGGFLRNVDQFDTGFFGIAPREAQGIDPQQRLLLEVSWEALENAGQAPTRLETSKTGVYFGLCTNDYSYLAGPQRRSRSLLNAHFGSGIAHSVASGACPICSGCKGLVLQSIPHALRPWLPSISPVRLYEAAIAGWRLPAARTLFSGRKFSSRSPIRGCLRLMDAARRFRRPRTAFPAARAAASSC